MYVHFKADNVCVLQMSVISPKGFKRVQKNHMFHFMQRNSFSRFREKAQVSDILLSVSEISNMNQKEIEMRAGGGGRRLKIFYDRR